MRKREEIESEISAYRLGFSRPEHLAVELLLDIRGILIEMREDRIENEEVIDAIPEVHYHNEENPKYAIVVFGDRHYQVFENGVIIKGIQKTI